MRVNLKGINSKTVKLADGTVKTYRWAWKGGPALKGEPGSPEFIASYNAAHSTKREPPVETMLTILREYQDSQAFKDLSNNSKVGYVRCIKLIEASFHDYPLSAMADRRTRGEFLVWRDLLAQTSKRQADYAWSVLARVLSFALNRGRIDANPCTVGGRLYRGGTRKNKTWSHADEAAFMAVAPDRLQLAFMLGLWTGQRQGDLLRLTWSAYDGAYIRLTQSKTGIPVVIPVGRPLKIMLDRTPRLNDRILVNIDGKPWTEDGFRTSWRKIYINSKVKDRTFHDLRGTAVTRLAIAGCTEAEIATITGHSLADVRSILDANYLSRDTELADSAVRKLERAHKKRTKIPE